MLGALRKFVQQRDEDHWTGRRESSVLWVLRLATDKDEQTAGRVKVRSRLAAALELADLNDIKPKMLLAFLYEAGATVMIERDIKDRVVYPWAQRYR